VIIGTAGHIDHGKTALVHALTGVDTDRLKEEKARGISIDLGFAYLATPDGSTLGFVDVPGHEKFVHNMLAGATGIDFVVLVVAADDGPMPQTVEHLAIVDLLGVTSGVIAVTKADLVERPALDAVARAVRQATAGTVLADAALIPVSTVTGDGVDVLRDHLLAAARRIDRRPCRGRFRLAVDRSFTLAGVGTVVTGTVLSGSVAVDDRVTISPGGLAARVRSLHTQNRVAAHGRTGERCALNLTGDGVSKDAVGRGDVVVDSALHAPADRIDATLRVLASEPKPVGQWMSARLHHAAADVGARLVLLADEPIPPGAESLVQLVLDRPIAAAVGDRYILRDPSARRTIGGGRFLDLRAPARKRRTGERLGQLAAHGIADPAQALAALLARPPYFVELPVFTRDRALTETEAAAAANGTARIATPAGAVVLAQPVLARIEQGIVATLAAFHADSPDLPGLGTERLRQQIEPRLPAPVFTGLLRRMAHEQTLALDGAWARLPSHTVRLTADDESAWASVQPLLAGNCRFRPPRVRDIGGLLSLPEADVRRLLRLLGRIGRVDEVAHDHFFLRETVAEMASIATELAGLAPDGQFTAARFRDRLDNGRKVAIQILEFFDRHGVTLRRGDLRRMNKYRLDLFRAPAAADERGFPGRPAPAERPDVTSGRGRELVPGGVDSESLPPSLAQGNDASASSLSGGAADRV
jgi:selenocysteine-specific elongation factor